MGLVASSFAAAVVAVLIVSVGAALARRCSELLIVAGFVFLMFWASRFIAAEIEAPWSRIHYPFQDLFLLITVIAFGVKTDRWKLAVAGALVAQLALHAAYWGLHAAGLATPLALWCYTLLNNIGFAVILLSLITAGGAHVLSRLGGLPGGADMLPTRLSSPRAGASPRRTARRFPSVEVTHRLR